MRRIWLEQRRGLGSEPCRHCQVSNVWLVFRVLVLGFLGSGFRICGFDSWIITIIWLYIALNRTPIIDCYWVGAVPKV